jgi:hypothetical protein
MARNAYVYRLDFTWPNPADEYQWGRKVYRVRYLTLRGARYQAGVLRSRGAVVEVIRSLPVKWPDEAVTP